MLLAFKLPDTPKKPDIALLVGEGVRSYDAGEVWHLLDMRYHIPITKIDILNIHNIDLAKYSHLVLPDYNSNSLDNEQIEKNESKKFSKLYF